MSEGKYRGEGGVSICVIKAGNVGRVKANYAGEINGRKGEKNESLRGLKTMSSNSGVQRSVGKGEGRRSTCQSLCGLFSW